MKYEHLTRLAARYRLVLGSGSPRRVRLLKETGVNFEQIIPQLNEQLRAGEQAFEFAERMAVEKARQVYEQVDEGHVVIGCDTVVVVGEQLLGKPSDAEDAMRILTTLSGRKHTVCTAVALVGSGEAVVSGRELTQVYFNEVSRDQIEKYIDSGEPMDKAGAYGIQGMGGFLVDRIEGHLDNVIGLPCLLLEKLAFGMLETER
jgi:septum formation protein